MHMFSFSKFSKFSKFLAISGTLFGVAAQASQYEVGRRALQSFTGCYLVDYSYTETRGLKPGYVRDERVYDVNKKQSVKEWIYAEEISPNRIRLQHVLFATDLSGKLIEGSVLKHQVEDWEYGAPFLYNFVAPSVWSVESLTANLNQWTRRVTNLDDGPRYQCSAEWSESTIYPEWTCDNFSPIPGRETRDMGRKDYNTLQRSTRIVAYGNSWLERQNNIKTIYADGVKTPLAEEVGKNWYVRLPDAECAPAQEFAEPRRAFWSLLREVWDEVLSGKEGFVEKSVPGQPPRYVKIWAIEEKYLEQDLNDPAVRERAKEEIMKVINSYRANLVIEQ